MSLVQFNPATNTLETISLHYYEKEEFRRAGSADKFMKPMLTVDPDQRCAILSFYGDKLAILPLRSNVGEEATATDG
jgi:cleavage and polyadenylation specificity factor subunit 1